MFEFVSEPGICVCGTEFRVSTVLLIDERGHESVTQRASGRNGTSCAWFFVPPTERIRLEALGAKFTSSEQVTIDKRTKLVHDSGISRQGSLTASQPAL